MWGDIIIVCFANFKPGVIIMYNKNMMKYSEIPSNTTLYTFTCLSIHYCAGLRPSQGTEEGTKESGSVRVPQRPAAEQQNNMLT